VEVFVVAVFVVSLFWFWFFETGSCHVAQAGLEFINVLPLPPESLDHRHPPSHPALFLFLIRGFCCVAQAGFELLDSGEAPAS
jgi:hypothetical protein